MDKTKRQLRAEAVERIKNLECHSIGAQLQAVLGYTDWNHDWDETEAALIDLLTDDEPTNGTADGTNGIASDCSLDGEPPEGSSEVRAGSSSPEGDAVAIMRRALDNDSSPTLCALIRYLGIGNGMSVSWNEAEAALRMLADMVERDYVRRDEYDNERNALLDKLVAANDAINELQTECGEYAQGVHGWNWRVECEGLSKRVKELTAERDELRGRVDELTKQRNRAESDAKTQRNNFDQATGARGHWKRKAEKAERERDEWKAKAESETNLEWLFNANAVFRRKVCETMGLMGCHTITPWPDGKPFAEWCVEPHVSGPADEAWTTDDDGTRPIGETCAENYTDADAEQRNPSSREADSGADGSEGLRALANRIAELEKMVDKAIDERDGYRAKCGRMLGFAHDIQMEAWA